MTIDPTKPIETKDGREAKILGGPSRDGMYFIEYIDTGGEYTCGVWKPARMSTHFRNLDPSRLTIEVDGVKEEVRCWQCDERRAGDGGCGFTAKTSDAMMIEVWAEDGTLRPEANPQDQTFPITAPRPWLTDEVKQRIAAFISDERKRRKAKADYSKLTTPKGRVCEMVNLDNGIDTDPCWARIGGRVLCVGKHSVTCDDEDGLENAKPNAWPFPPETGARIDALIDEMEAKAKPVEKEETFPEAVIGSLRDAVQKLPAPAVDWKRYADEVFEARNPSMPYGEFVLYEAVGNICLAIHNGQCKTEGER